jgi:hypothetical protein
MTDTIPPAEQIRCERCGTIDDPKSAEACLWWPAGCKRGELRVCWNCCSDAERHEVAATGCTAARFALMLLDDNEND